MRRVQNGNRTAISSKKVLQTLLGFGFAWEEQRTVFGGASEMVAKLSVVSFFNK